MYILLTSLSVAWAKPIPWLLRKVSTAGRTTDAPPCILHLHCYKYVGINVCMCAWMRVCVPHHWCPSQYNSFTLLYVCRYTFMPVCANACMCVAAPLVPLPVQFIYIVICMNVWMHVCVWLHRGCSSLCIIYMVYYLHCYMCVCVYMRMSVS